MYQKTALSSGLRVITSTVPHAHSVSLAILVGTGSRYEEAEKAGISHFIEHLCFKGTKRRATAKEIAAAIEGIGGTINGGTDKELTLYWCKVPLPHFHLAVDVLTDMLSQAKFEPEDIERERQVIIEEIKMSWDNPQSQVHLLSEELLWPEQPLGRDTAGTRDSVANITRQDMLNYLEHYYSANNIVVAIAGNISHEEVLNSLGQAFEQRRNYHPEWYPAIEKPHPQIAIEPREIEQAHFCLTLPGLSFKHPDRFTLELLVALLGEGMSSRLFTEIREKRALAYAVQSSVTHYLDTGSIVIYAGVASKNLTTAVAAIIEELHRVKEDITEEELSRVKEFSKGRLLLRLEETRNLATYLGAQELLLNKIITIDELIAIVDAISIEEIERVARQNLVAENFHLAVVGPVAEEEASLKKLLSG